MDNKIVKTMQVPFIAGLENKEGEEIFSTLAGNVEGTAIDVLNWPEQYPYAPDCVVRLARGYDHFAISFEVEGLDLRATEMEDNGRSWEDSCCEFFLSPDGKEYYNIETTCIGSILMARGCERNNRTTLDSSEVAKIKRWSSLEKKRYEIDGGIHKWSIALLIPFSVVGLDPENLPDEIGGNFYKCGDLTAHPHFVSWNPIAVSKPDFHRPDYFGRLLFK